MAFFDFLKSPSFNELLKEYLNTPNSVLIDVRTSREYAGGHVPKSVNVPLHKIDGIVSVAADKDAPLFVYCQSGLRSRQAVAELKNMGYTNVKNLGGITSYKGSLET